MKSFLILILLIGFWFSGFSQKNEISQAFINRNYDKVIELGNKILQFSPQNIDVHLAIARAYNLNFDFKKAIPHLQSAIKYAKSDWQFSWTHIELTESYFSLGGIIKAKEHYKKALLYNGTKNSSNKLKRLSRLLGMDSFYNTWKTQETKNIIFHFQDTTTVKDINKYMQEREVSFENINAFFKATLPKKIDFFVWKSNEIAYGFLKQNIGFTKPEYCTSHNRPNQTKGHEIAHNISFWHSAPATKTRLINEGIAVYFDQTKFKKIVKAQQVAKTKQVDIEKFWINGNGIKEEIFYPIAGAFVEHMINYDKDKFLKLCKNQSYEDAKNIYGKELKNIINEFTSQLEQ